MQLLVFNAGSSSLKFDLMEVQAKDLHAVSRPALS